MEKRALIAIVLSFAIFLGYEKVLRTFYPPQEGLMTGSQSIESPSAGSGVSLPEVQKENIGPTGLSIPSENVMPAGSSEDVSTIIETEAYVLSVSEQSGSITGIGIKSFIDPYTNEPLQFIDAQKGSWGTGAVEVWVNGKLITQWQTAFESKSEGYVFSKENSDIRVVQEFEGHENAYGNDYHVYFENKTSSDINVRFRINAGSGVVAKNTIDRQYIEANWIRGEQIKHPKAFKEGKIKSSEESYPVFSIKSRHFSAIMKPVGDVTYFPFLEGISRDDFVSAAQSQFELAAEGKKQRDFMLYVGPNKVSALAPYDLSQVVNFGKMDPICKLLIGGLQSIGKIVHNYGVAIIILTIMTNLLLSPLTKASFMSMQRMQLVQPQMKKIREKYKSDPTKLNQETMALYKKHKINPMGGCLPMIVQMPIFISLYVALSKSIDLLNAKFLWIKDLASPDVIPLPFTLPLFGDTIHLLPLIMVVAMVAQQKISMASAASMDPQMAQQQKMMMTIMPVFFGFIFYPMPSGLVIYWLTNTVVTTTYQKYLRSRTTLPVAST